MAAQSKEFLKGCSPAFREYRLMREFVFLQEQSITNVYVVPSHGSPFIWFGVCFVHEGLFQGSIHRFNIEIPQEYPETKQSPIITFEDPPPFHPLVNREGKLNFRHVFQEWNPSNNKIHQLVRFLKSIFVTVKDDIEAVKTLFFEEGNDHQKEDYNLEVVRLYMDDHDAFLARVAQSVEDSITKIYEFESPTQDMNAIVFGPWNPEIHEETRRMILSGCDQPTSSPTRRAAALMGSGLSWLSKIPPRVFPKPFS